MCFFQNHNKVKTPELHPSRCIQEHYETSVSVSAHQECSKEEHVPLQHVLFKQIVSPKWVTGDRPTSDGPPHDPRHNFLISLDPLEEEIKCHSSSQGSFFLQYELYNFKLFNLFLTKKY